MLARQLVTCSLSLIVRQLVTCSLSLIVPSTLLPRRDREHGGEHGLEVLR